MRIKFLATSACWLALIVSTHSYSSDNDSEFMRGYEELTSGNYRKAALIWKSLSESGHEQSSVNLAGLYLLGQGVDKDLKKAYAMFDKASKNGNTLAIFNMGVIYKDGLGVEIDHKKAISFFEAAAKRDSLDAYHNLGFMYQHGLGVEVDFDKSKKYYLYAAEHGFAQSQNDVAFFYSEDQRYFPVEPDKALYWYKKSASQLFPDALVNLGIAYFHGIGVPKDLVKAYSYFIVAGELGSLKAVNYSKSAMVTKPMTMIDFSLANEMVRKIKSGNPI